MPVSASALQAMFSEGTSEVLVMLIEVNYPDGPDVAPWPFLVCDNSTDIEQTSTGKTFLGIPDIQVVPPTEKDRGTASASVIIPGISDGFIREMRDLDGQPPATVQLVLASAPNDILYQFADMLLVDVSGTPLGIEFTFQYEELHRSPYPKKRFSFAKYPGLYS